MIGLGIVLGVVIGLLMASLAFLIVIYFKTPIERTINQAKNKVPTQKGAIIPQDSAVQIAQKRLIDANQDKGGTPLSDLL